MEVNMSVCFIALGLLVTAQFYVHCIWSLLRIWHYKYGVCSPCASQQHGLA